MVKKGYKQTEVGVIPEDWSVRALKDVAPLQRGYDLPYLQMKEGCYPVVFSNGVCAYHTRYMVKGPGVITGRSGTIGKVHYVDNNYWPHNTSLWVTNFHGNYPKYVYYLFNTINWQMYNSGSGVPTLNRNDIHELNCAMPPLPEQHRIAEALSDVDGMISSLEKLIAKYKSIKAACLQQMFPQNGETIPRMRLPGFTDAWEQRKLNEITDVRDGTHDSPKYVPEGHPFITSKNVSNGFINYDDVQYVADEDYEEINKRSNVDVHDILMGMIGTIGNLALIRKEPNFAIKNVALIKYTGGIDYQYLFQALQANCVTSQLSTGMDGGTQKFVSLKKIRELDIPFPEEHEQLKIGAYFLYLDHLITLYQRKLKKVQKIKQGMMQQLLTGKIRLV